MTDFRSADGLYNLVKQQYPDVVLKGRDLFDASLFRDATSTSVFYTFISKLKQCIDSATPSPTHRFIKTLDTKKKLLRSYTQNIDGLEERVGLMGSSSSNAKTAGKGKAKIRIRDVKNVQLHGDIHSVRCVSCSAEYPCMSDHVATFIEGAPPPCPECASRLEARVARSARAIRVGTLRPSIVLYDEPHPLGEDIGAMQSADVGRKPDMLIIMGTSLKVHGLRKMVKEFAKTVHGSGPSTGKPWQGKVIFVNLTPHASEWNDIIDYHIEGETDRWVEKVIEDWKKMRPADWEVQQTLVAADGDVSMSGGFKTVKSVSTPKRKGKGGKAEICQAGVTKKHHDEENLPPDFADMVLSTPDALVVRKAKAALMSPGGNDMVLSTPDAIAARKGKVATPPLSPSKRTQGASHYDDLESSPSKRRVSPLKNQLQADERKALFAASNSGRIHQDDMFDLFKDEVKTKTQASKSTKPAKMVKATVPTTVGGKTGDRSTSSRASRSRIR
ncbi:hypothetical protein H0H93_014198 [Arthromyces matolae]|nr:hypothetical protein H0H93_014198 [Arthromyces matolae]